MAATSAIFDAQNASSPLSVPASKTALLLCDFHKFFIGSMPPEGQAAVETASALRQWARSQNMIIVHCLIDFDVDVAPQLKMSSRAGQLQAVKESGGPDWCGEAPEIAAVPGEYVFWRPLGRISALSSYGLQDFLKQKEIRSVVVTGVATSGCVVDTAKAFSEIGMIVSVIEDACADRVVETHNFIMQKLLTGQCHVASKEKFVEAWK